jgi:glycosyltransferase involved in cell wall biosynthesis
MIQFSVVVPYYNEAKKLPALLKSIREIDFDKCQVEFIFVSNNSTDESDSLVREAGFHLEIAGRLNSSYYARNIGISAASGKYIVFVDADCILDKHILNGYSNAIKANLGTGPKIYAGNIFPAVQTGSLVETYSAARRILNQKSAATGWAYKPFAQTANAMFLRRDLLDICGFNENMTSGGDAEICWRLAKKHGHQVVLCEEAIVYHQHRQTIEDFIAQFMKYGRGRFQQALACDIFAKEKKPDDLNAYKERSSKLVEDLRKSGCEEETLHKVLDLLKDLHFNLGFLDELISYLQKQTGSINYEFVSNVNKLNNASIISNNL